MLSKTDIDVRVLELFHRLTEWKTPVRTSRSIFNNLLSSEIRVFSMWIIFIFHQYMTQCIFNFIYLWIKISGCNYKRHLLMKRHSYYRRDVPECNGFFLCSWKMSLIPIQMLKYVLSRSTDRGTSPLVYICCDSKLQLHIFPKFSSSEIRH